jgi:hypothetical protein
MASGEEKGTKQGIGNSTNMHSTPASPAESEIEVSVVAPANSRKQVLPQCRYACLLGCIVIVCFHYKIESLLSLK